MQGEFRPGREGQWREQYALVREHIENKKKLSFPYAWKSITTPA